MESNNVSISMVTRNSAVIVSTFLRRYVLTNGARGVQERASNISRVGWFMFLRQFKDTVTLFRQ
ncbi:MAG: hypothetical protein DWC00_02355 [Candidatus Poseidoniales archaeon]|nr:MAG: hypothetical protein DWC00_02355 [Candidatus Poseidoniales archaeon]